MSGSGGVASDANEYSGFGFAETPTVVETCKLERGRRRNKASVTDLYCHDHGRFLPLIGVSVAIRVTVAIISTLIVYGCLEWTAQTGARGPIFVVYAALLLGFVALPLRHFPGTAVAASVIWLAGSLTVVICRFTGDALHVIAAAVAVACGAAILALWAIARDSPGASARATDFRAVTRAVTAAWIVAGWSALAALLVHYDSYALPGSESALVTAMVIIALIALVIGILIVSVSSLALGAGRVQKQVNGIPKPPPPGWGMPTMRSPGPGNRRPGNAADLIVDAFIRALYVVAVTVGNALAVVGRVATNCIAWAAYAVASVIITVANLLIRLAILTLRWVRASLATAGQLSHRAFVATCRAISDSIVSVFVPTISLFLTPWLVLAMATESRQYLRHGSLPALGLLVVLLAAASALLLGTWVILANQDPRESLRSAGRSIPITAAYGLVFLLFGGWLLGILGWAGYGRIRPGPVTFALTGLAALALVYRLISRRAEPSAPVAAASRPSAYGDRRWTASIALAMIAGTVAGMAAFLPRGPSGPPPVKLVAEARTTSSVLIAWLKPRSGASPTSYTIEQDGIVVASVPGTATSYRATALAPGTAYTYQVIAVRGTRWSTPSTAMTTRTRTPPAWQATLTGSWTVHYTRVTSNMSNSPDLTAATWAFANECAMPQCPLTLGGALNQNNFSATLRLSGHVYAGTSADNTYFYCDSVPMNAVLTLKITALTGKVTGKQWTASSWDGFMTLDAPAESGCSPTNLTAAVSAAR